ncbi:hypothetical protein [Roseomonas rosulenta]|uniref:hypothetical protein n=1 Tax=Roseomonas rosulenta TaxID=2748667 RepID=UPI0018DFE689|nr:hypothetical protein [Roseomonas rosulenta]
MIRPAPTPLPGRAGRRALLALPLASAGCATGLGEPLPGPPKGRIALFRGIGDISTGLDDLARRLREGGYAATVHNHLARDDVTERLLRLAEAGRLPRPLCLGGHSLGADAAIEASASLWAAGIATEELVTLDPVLVGDVAAGPRHVTNFYQAGNGFGRPLQPAPGFTGAIENIDLRDRPGLWHFNMDADAEIHRRILMRIRDLRRALLAGPSPRAP